MIKDSSEEDSQKFSETVIVREGRGAKRACRKSETVSSPKPNDAAQSDAPLSSITTDDQHLDTASSCYTLLREVCAQANLIRLHCHRETLLASDLCKAGDILKLQSKTNEKKKKKVDLESCLKKKVNVIEREKIFYYGHCLHYPKTSETGQSSKEYFELCLKSVFGNNSELFSLMLSDLKKNSSILPILPIFIHNLCNNAVLLNHQPSTVEKFLRVIHSLYLNPNLYFPNEYLLKIIDFTVSVALTNLHTMFHKPEVIFSLQNYAAEILCDIIVKNSFIYSHLHSYILIKLIAPFTVSQQKLIPCHGSLTVACKLGLGTVASLLPYLFLSKSVKKQFLYKITDAKQICSQNHSQVMSKKLYAMCQTIVENSLSIALSFPKINEFYKMIHSTHKENMPDPDMTLNAELCCAILNHYGENFSSSLPSILNIHNEAVPAQEVFEKCKFEDKND